MRASILIDVNSFVFARVTGMDIDQFTLVEESSRSAHIARTCHIRCALFMAAPAMPGAPTPKFVMTLQQAIRLFLAHQKVKFMRRDRAMQNWHNIASRACRQEKEVLLSHWVVWRKVTEEVVQRQMVRELQYTHARKLQHAFRKYLARSCTPRSALIRELIQLRGAQIPSQEALKEAARTTIRHHVSSRRKRRKKHNVFF